MPNCSTWKSRVAREVEKKSEKLNKWKMEKLNFSSHTRFDFWYNDIHHKVLSFFEFFGSWKMKNVNETLVGSMDWISTFNIRQLYKALLYLLEVSKREKLWKWKLFRLDWVILSF